MRIEKCDEFFYRVSSLDKNIFKDLNIDYNNIVRNNNKIKIYVGEWIKVKVNNFIVHHVKPIENLNIIAKKYNINKEKLVEDNHLKCEKLFIGQEIKIFGVSDKNE